jgi:hypothetical protein
LAKCDLGLKQLDSAETEVNDLLAQCENPREIAETELDVLLVRLTMRIEETANWIDSGKVLKKQLESFLSSTP